MNLIALSVEKMSAHTIRCEFVHYTSTLDATMLGGMSRFTSMMNNQRIAKLIQFESQESEYIEPGLLPMFRLFVGLQLLVIIFIRSQLDLPNLAVRDFVTWALVWMLLFMAYLVWPTLPRRLGKYYLPIALIAGSVLPIVIQTITRTIILDLEAENAPVILYNTSWTLLLFSFVLLVFIAWQYKFWHVALFGLGIPVLNMAITIRGNDIPLPAIFAINVNGMISFLLVGYIIAQLRKVQREKQLALVEANAKLFDYAATIEQLTVSRERNRLARDMHDTLAHTLSAVSVQLEAADSVWEVEPEQAHDLMQKSLASARAGLTETRRALHALRVSPLDNLGLGLALRDLAESTADRTGWQLEIDIANEVNLPPELEQNVYRIAQEALTNIARHANAKHVSLSLARENERVQMTIRDDGIGFSQDEMISEVHFGLRGMVERAEQMGAKLVVDSSPDRGTKVQLMLKRTIGGSL